MPLGLLIHFRHLTGGQRPLVCTLIVQIYVIKREEVSYYTFLPHWYKAKVSVHRCWHFVLSELDMMRGFDPGRLLQRRAKTKFDIASPACKKSPRSRTTFSGESCGSGILPKASSTSISSTCVRRSMDDCSTCGDSKIPLSNRPTVNGYSLMLNRM